MSDNPPIPMIVEGAIFLCVLDANGIMTPLPQAVVIPVPPSWTIAINKLKMERQDA